MGIKKITDDTRYRYVLKMLKSGTEIDYDYLIKCYMDKGIININDIMKSSREDLMKSIIGKVHYYAISPTSGNRYMTYIDDCTKPSNRRDIKRKAEEDLYKFLFVYYGTSDLVKNITFKDGPWRKSCSQNLSKTKKPLRNTAL